MRRRLARRRGFRVSFGVGRVTGSSSRPRRSFVVPREERRRCALLFVRARLACTSAVGLLHFRRLPVVVSWRCCCCFFPARVSSLLRGRRRRRRLHCVVVCWSSARPPPLRCVSPRLFLLRLLRVAHRRPLPASVAHRRLKNALLVAARARRFRRGGRGGGAQGLRGALAGTPGGRRRPENAEVGTPQRRRNCVGHCGKGTGKG